MNPYFKQKAAPWVSISVLAGGLITAVLLLVITRIESNIVSVELAEEGFAQIEQTAN